MASDCNHNGFHSGVGKLSTDFSSIRFVLVCDGCGQEIREVHVEQYEAAYDPSGNARRGRAA